VLRHNRHFTNLLERKSSVTDAKDPKLALFELYLATAEKVSDRRAQANAWMLSVTSAIVALYGYLPSDKTVVAGQIAIWLWAIPAAGAIVCIAWVALLASYRKLHRAARKGFAGAVVHPRISDGQAKIAICCRNRNSRRFLSALFGHAWCGDPVNLDVACTTLATFISMNFRYWRTGVIQAA
jgi:hypothetical protein